MIQFDKMNNLTPPPVVMHCTYPAESISEVVPGDVAKKERRRTTEQSA